MITILIIVMKKKLKKVNHTLDVRFKKLACYIVWYSTQQEQPDSTEPTDRADEAAYKSFHGARAAATQVYCRRK
jgi:hypothetical protein